MLALTRRKFFGLLAALLGTSKAVEVAPYIEVTGRRRWTDIIPMRYEGPRTISGRWVTTRESIAVQDGDRIAAGIGGSFEIERADGSR